MQQTTHSSHSPDNPSGSQVDIVKRLEKLNKWQEEQQKILDERQNVQRQMLGMEQRDMYHILGLTQTEGEDPARTEGIETSDTIIGDGPHLPHKHTRNDEKHTIRIDKKMHHSLTMSKNFTKERWDSDQVNNEDDTENVASQMDEEEKSYEQHTRKKKFLKRGEGLKRTFKISPEALRINNLPRYRYATTHPKIQKIRSKSTLNTPKSSTTDVNENSNNDDYGDDNDKDTFMSKLDAQEKRFQQLLVSSKNACNSTPDIKSTNPLHPATLTITLPKVRFSKQSCRTRNRKEYATSAAPATSSTGDMKTNNQELQQHDAMKTSIDNSPPQLSWSKVLDSQQIKPIPVHQIRKSQESFDEQAYIEERMDDENLSIFELLEEKANEGTIDMNSSCIKRFMKRKFNRAHANEPDDIPVDKSIREKHINPQTAVGKDINVDDIMQSDATSNDDDDDDITDTEQTLRHSDKHSETSLKSQVRVRFSDAPDDTQEYYNNNNNSDVSTVADDDEAVSVRSSELYQQFKDALFSALLLGRETSNANTTGDNTDCTAIEPCFNIPSISAPLVSLPYDLQEKSRIIKERLDDLEKEIASFQHSNQQLLREKQEHALERAHFDKERLEVFERLNDNKIQMEIYLHDERMKIEDEKRKLEQLARAQKTALSQKERKEMAKLKEEIESLKQQIKDKDQAHASAQARLRVQIRNFDRDQKLLYEEMEKLQKEIKRLQFENEKIERENNNKLLNEINKNIARLAPKPGTTIPKRAKDETLKRRAKSTTSSSHRPFSKDANLYGHTRSLTKTNAGDFPTAPPPPTRNNSVTNVTTSGAALMATKTTQPATPTSNELATDQNLYKHASYIDYDKDHSRESDKHNIHCNVNHFNDDDDDDEDISKELQNYIPLKSNHNDDTQTDNIPAHNAVVALAATSLDGDVIDPNNNNNNNSSNSKSKSNNLKREIINADGSRDIIYVNGNIKKISADGLIIRMLYFNKDIKETNINDGTIKYYYAETNTWHTTYLDGLEILEFPNGQTEHRFKDGVIEIHFPDSSVKLVNPADKECLEEWRFMDGTNLIQMRNGDRILMMANGQKEIHTKLNKRREYPDGTVKLVYPDGSQETRYSNGRVRLKDKEGNLVMDTANAM